jgi:AraC-like DNA-binding protein
VKISGTGRIALWRGGSLWIGRVGEPTDSHAHHAVQMTLALTPGGLRLRTPDKAWTHFQSAVIRAHQAHAFDARGETVVHVFAEPESREGRVLQQRYRGIEALEGEATRRAAGRLGSLFAQRAPDASLVEEGRALIRALAGGDEAAQPLDPRIARAIDVLRTRLGQATRLSEAARSAHLSPERFRHLFLEETGMRFRPYVLWLRLERALEAYAAGESLTGAAQAGGFADSAHLSRTFRRMFGVAPASLTLE